MFFKKIIILFILFFLSCAKKPDAGITILVPDSISSIPFMEMDRKTIGGQKITIKGFSDHMSALLEFSKNPDMLLFTGFSVGLSSYSKIKTIRHIATPVWGVASLVTLNPKLNSIENFKNRQILVPFPKSPLDLQLQAILRLSSLQGKIRIGYSQVQQSMQLLLQKKTDGICIPEPLASKIVLEHNGYRAFSFSDKWTELNHDKLSPQVSLFAKKETMEKFPGLAEQIRQETEKNISYIKSHRSDIIARYSGRFKIQKNTLDAALQNITLKLEPPPREKMLIESYQKTLGGEIPDRSFYFFHD